MSTPLAPAGILARFEMNFQGIPRIIAGVHAGQNPTGYLGFSAGYRIIHDFQQTMNKMQTEGLLLPPFKAHANDARATKVTKTPRTLLVITHVKFQPPHAPIFTLIFIRYIRNVPSKTENSHPAPSPPDTRRGYPWPRRSARRNRRPRGFSGPSRARRCRCRWRRRP